MYVPTTGQQYYSKSTSCPPPPPPTPPTHQPIDPEMIFWPALPERWTDVIG